MASISGPAGANSAAGSATANLLKTAAEKKTKSGEKPKAVKGSKKKTAAENQSKDSATLSQAKSASLQALTGVQSPIQGAKELPGLFKLYQKDNKTMFAIAPEQFNKPFFFSSNVSKSVGERRLVGSEMGDSYLAEFRKVGDSVQLVALHTENFAEAGSPQEQFVKEGYSDSLISSADTKDSGLPNKEVLVDAGALLFGDVAGYAARLERTYGSKFGVDIGNTSFTQVDNCEDQTSFGVQAHYLASLATRGDLPSTTPIANSLLTEFRYNFLKLPETPMTPRLADDRIGHFVTTRKDYTGDVGDGKVRYVNRWRLEKKDPDAPMSKPVKPITYWIAKDVPEKYRKAVKEGVLEWNKAFERIGFEDAIVVKQQKDTDTFDTLDARHASVRWYTAADVGSAVGPSHVDPRSGEILDADIRMADVFGRSAQKVLIDNPTQDSHGHLHDGHECQYQAHAGIEKQFATGLLDARGDTKASQKLADAYIKDVVMHEVGHTLGLRHNFKGSTVFTPEQLQDSEFTKQNGLGSTVMDYHPFNIAEPGEKQGEYVMSTLGAYDYLAIQYAYAPIDPSMEKEVLNNIAVQTTTNPHLAFETDEAADDLDPSVSRFDLGNDPLQFSAKEIRLAQELWERAQSKELPEGTSYQEHTHDFIGGLSKIGKAARQATRYVGGLSLRRDRAGTDKPVYEPIPADKQREAVALITDTLFKPDNFRFKPEFVARLGQERFDNWGDQNIHPGLMVLKTQVKALEGLYDPDIAQRLIDNPDKLPADAPKYEIGELYQTIQSSIWSELSEKSDIPQARRDLQRQHIKVMLPIMSEDSKAPGEARSMMRYMTRQLQAEIEATLKGEMSLSKRAHLEDCRQTLDKALKEQ